MDQIMELLNKVIAVIKDLAAKYGLEDILAGLEGYIKF